MQNKLAQLRASVDAAAAPAPSAPEDNRGASENHRALDLPLNGAGRGDISDQNNSFLGTSAAASAGAAAAAAGPPAAAGLGAATAPIVNKRAAHWTRTPQEGRHQPCTGCRNGD